jgi:hypothetical protein
MERELLIEILFNREAALAFDFTEMGQFRIKVEPPHVIHMISHDHWQEARFKIPRALDAVVIEILKVQIEVGRLDRYQGPYGNTWFLMNKKQWGHRIVASFAEANSYKVLEVALPPRVVEFSEEFARMAIASIIDLFSEYDQVELTEKSRDMIASQIPLGLLCFTGIVQGGTNSIQAFQQINTKIQDDNILECCRVFLDNVGGKGPTTRYDNIETYPGIRQFVLKHIMNLDPVLAD